MDGEILFNGSNPSPFYDNGSVAYVQQQDHLLPYLTGLWMLSCFFSI